MGVNKAKLLGHLQAYDMQAISVPMPPGIMQVSLLIELVKMALAILCDQRKFKSETHQELDRGGHELWPSGECVLLVGVCVLLCRLVLVSKGGFHRSGTVAACILCALGLPPEQAIRSVAA